MSAIWGMINLDGKEADNTQGVKMEEAMKQYKIDRFLTLKKENAIFGCGIQHITAEAVNEQLPYYDEVNKLFYTADCMLDNREELIEKLSLKDTAVPDGALLYQAFLSFGTEFTEHVLGIFSLVIYDFQKNSCTMFTDHTGSRSLYYCIADKTVYFATVFMPLITVLPDDYKKINEKWMAACELTPTPVMNFFPELTPFEMIGQVLAGHSITIQLNGTKVNTVKKCYWGYKQRKTLKLKSQEEYRELFTKTLFKCVKSVLRSSENTGITLSSGLDSSSVACVAANILADMNKELYSFTSIPLYKADDNIDPYYITDESSGVIKICNAYSNIIPEFVSCIGKNTCTELKRLVRYLEFPHKSRQNMVWLDEIYERAASKGCKVVLKGQFGNATISQGKILSKVYDEIKGLHFINAYKEAEIFCKKNHVSRKRILKMFITELKERIWYPTNRFEDSIVLRELLNKHKIPSSMNRIFKAKGTSLIQSRAQQQEFMYDMMVYIQMGALDTRLSLYHGIIIRDPLKDKRMIELCASFPMKCFVQDGIERSAVRQYMRGIVPDTILENVSRRGLQSADYINRLKMDWDRTKKTMLEMLEEPRLFEYFRRNDIEQIKEEVRINNILNSEKQLMDALMLCSCSIFLNSFGY